MQPEIVKALHGWSKLDSTGDKPWTSVALTGLGRTTAYTCTHKISPLYMRPKPFPGAADVVLPSFDRSLPPRYSVCYLFPTRAMQPDLGTRSAMNLRMLSYSVPSFHSITSYK